MAKKVLKSKVKKDGDFIPPDGGWGWMIIIAAGLSNLSALPLFQQFGLLFRDRLARMDISSSETTTILNVHSAFVACVGLANGPVFRAFSYRQVTMTGAILVVISLVLTTFSYSFINFLITFSLLYGASYGMTSNSNDLALNTYWKERRRLAAGLSSTATGLGTMIWPYIITALYNAFGETGTLLIISGVSFHTIACALLLQPVELHSKKSTLKTKDHKIIKEKANKSEKNTAFSGQYLNKEDDPINSLTSFSLTSTLYLNDSKKHSSANLGALAQEQETLKPEQKSPILTCGDFVPESEIENRVTIQALKVNEKVFVDKIDPKEGQVIVDGAKKHLAGNKRSKSLKYGENYQKDNQSNISLKTNEENEDRKYLRDNHSNQSYRTKHRRKSNDFNFESEVLKQASLKLEEYLKEREDDTDKTKLIITPPVDNNSNTLLEKFEDSEVEELDEHLSIWQKISQIFDLDLLKDFTFVNLMTLACFCDLNFSLLTPFILGDYGISKGEIVFFMSLLAGVDISMRFCVPLIAGKIGWENNTFFLIGVMTMATGRIVLAYSQESWVLTLVAVIIGFGKGLRSVFMALVIPTYVPLRKLPGATGLQLITSGVVYLVLGPVVGWIKDNASTGVTLHCLNIFTYMTTLSWNLEKYIRSRHRKSIQNIDV